MSAEPERKLTGFIECTTTDCPARSYVLTLGKANKSLPWCKHHYEYNEVELMMAGHKLAVDDRPWLYWAESQHQRGVKRAVPAPPPKKALTTGPDPA